MTQSHIRRWHIFFRLTLNTFDDKEALQSEEARDFGNRITNKGSEEMDGRLQQFRVAQYSLNNQLLMNHLVIDAEWLMYNIRCVELNMWIGGMFALCALSEHRLHSL